MRGKRDAYHRTGLIVTLSFAALASLAQGPVGDWAGRTVTENQPVKLAAFEGLPHTEDSVPFTIGGYYDADDEEVRYGIQIPYLLSFLAHHDPTATVTGLDSVPKADQPPVNTVRFAFQTMAGIGTALAAIAAVFLLTWLFRGRLPRSPWFYRAVIAAGPLALIALISGWIATEVGRQPWIVYETMRTSDAVSASDGLEIGFAVLVAIYLALGAAFAWLMRRLTAKPEQEMAAR
jgi:cytochrome bd ubiquinol oxidase subunit I